MCIEVYSGVFKRSIAKSGNSGASRRRRFRLGAWTLGFLWALVIGPCHFPLGGSVVVFQHAANFTEGGRTKTVQPPKNKFRKMIRITQGSRPRSPRICWVRRFPVPEGQSRIARRFNVGSIPHFPSPEGTVDFLPKSSLTIKKTKKKLGAWKKSDRSSSPQHAVRRLPYHDSAIYISSEVVCAGTFRAFPIWHRLMFYNHLYRNGLFGEQFAKERQEVATKMDEMKSALIAAKIPGRADFGTSCAFTRLHLWPKPRTSILFSYHFYLDEFVGIICWHDGDFVGQATGISKRCRGQDR